VNQSNEWPTLLIRVVSVDYWERHRIVGHGYVNLPREPGRSCLQVSTVNLVHNSVFARLCEFFLGHSEEELEQTHLNVR